MVRDMKPATPVLDTGSIAGHAYYMVLVRDLGLLWGLGAREQLDPNQFINLAVEEAEVGVVVFRSGPAVVPVVGESALKKGGIGTCLPTWPPKDAKTPKEVLKTLEWSARIAILAIVVRPQWVEKHAG